MLSKKENKISPNNNKYKEKIKKYKEKVKKLKNHLAKQEESYKSMKKDVDFIHDKLGKLDSVVEMIQLMIDRVNMKFEEQAR